MIDLTPLKISSHYRRLWIGNALGACGSLMTSMAVGLQVYTLTGGSTYHVGLLGLCALFPMIVAGLYGGALSDHYDRRIVAGIAGLTMWLSTLGVLALTVAGCTAVWPFFIAVGVTSGAFAVANPARSSMLPRLVGKDLLPSAQALGFGAFNVAMLAAPWLATTLIHHYGYTWCYLVDALFTLATLYGIFQLPPMRPGDMSPVPERRARRSAATRREVLAEESSVIGGTLAVDASAPTPKERLTPLASMREGLGFLRTSPNIRMTFILDIWAMLLGPVRVFVPAAGLATSPAIFGGGEMTTGFLLGAFAVGAVCAMLTSGWFKGVRRQGLAVVVCIQLWCVAMVGFGASMHWAAHGGNRAVLVWVAAASLALAGASDSVSGVFRSTILQVSAPDDMRGRLGGIFIVVVAGGPRLGEFLGGFTSRAAETTGWGIPGEPLAAMAGGVLCMVIVATWALAQRGFLRYDARHPTP